MPHGSRQPSRKFVQTDELLSQSDTIRTSRLTLERCSPKDLRELEPILADERVCSQLGHLLDPPPTLQLTIRLRTTGVLIGGVDFQEDRLSYFIDPDYWKNGYAFEAVRAACRHWPDKLGISRLRAEARMTNLPSRLILEKLGFRLVRFEYDEKGDPFEAIFFYDLSF